MQAIEDDPLHYGNWYGAGQCFRFTNDFANAISHLAKASQLNPKRKPYFSRAGIALQLTDKFDEAINAFRRALDIYLNYDLAFNSLALTQMKQGDFDIARFIITMRRLKP